MSVFCLHLFSSALVAVCGLLVSVILPSIWAQFTYQLDGTPNSYLQYPSWHYFFATHRFTTKPEASSHEASLSFEFRCPPEPPNHSTTNARPIGGMLLYTDDQTNLGGVFLEIKLLSESNLRVRIDDSSAIRTKNIIELHQGINFTDGQWHRVELTRYFKNLAPTNDDLSISRSEVVEESIMFKVDSEVIHKKIELSYGHLEKSHKQANLSVTNQWLFIGGIPPEYRHGHHLSKLAMPTVAYELHFRGAIRNVLYAANSVDNFDQTSNDDNVNLRIQIPVSKGGLLVEEGHQLVAEVDSQCESTNNRCQHGGYCYSTRGGLYCDCSITDYEGSYCQKERHPLEATFRGTFGEYLGHNQLDLPNAWSFISTAELFELSFRTKQANSLLLFTSDQHDDYLVLELHNAAIMLRIKLGSVEHKKVVKPSKVRFDDNQWHAVLVERKIREISPSIYFFHFSITVDGIYTQHGSAAGVVPYFISKTFFVGGIAANLAVPAIIENAFVDSNGVSRKTIAVNNFIGCLRKIFYTADNARLDLLHLLTNQPQQLYQPIQQQFHNHSTVSTAVSLIRFFSDERFISSYGHQSSLMCQDMDTSDPITFTTADSYLKIPEVWNTPKEGTLSLKIRTNEPNGVLLYSMGADGQHHNNNDSINHDFFALELLDGQLYLIQHLGSAPVKVKASSRRIDDGHWHSISVRRSGRTGQVVVDDTVSDFISPGTSHHLDLSDVIYLGGLPRYPGHHLTYIPSELWSATFGFGYIGCVRDLILNNRVVDITTLAKKQDSGSVKPSCHSSPSQCANVPCQNGGICIEGWNRYSCDCSHTSYTGSVCAKNAATVNFNGEQYVVVNLSEELRFQAESLSIRFQTRRQNGLLLTTVHNTLADHYLTITLENAMLRVDLNYGEGHMERIITTDTPLNDDQWHTVHIERRGHQFEVELDRANKQVVELTGQNYTLHVSAIHIGARFNLPKTSHGKRKHFVGFIGSMQNFIFNGQSYFEKVRDGQLSNGAIRMTAKFGKKDRVLHNVVTFKSKYTFVGLPQLKAYSRLNIYFQFKTRELNGLIFFNGGGQRHDFIAVELVNGFLHYIFDLGDGPRRLQSKTRTVLNDNRWHSVTLGRPSLQQHTMLIDDSLITTRSSSGSERNMHLDLNGLLYFGGVRDNMWPELPKAIKSKHGFEGCIASLDLNGETFNLAGGEVLIPSTLVESGCSAPLARCSSTACANRGICVQLWNSYTCDCDLTTFSGPTCADGNESTAYQFGPNPGLITFTFDEGNQPDTRNDLLALGFLTTYKNGALIRIDSGSTADYLQLELLDGNVLVVYNLGTEDIDIGELGMKLNDGKYHIVRFTRSGQNSTLQIDNHNVLTRSPSGKQMNIFNTHSKIQIGGHKNVLKGSIEKPFVGIIAGLVFNGHRLLDMAAEDDPRVKIEGDLELMISIGNQGDPPLMPTASSNDKLHNQMLSEPKSPSPGNDDLIYSGAGSGCFDVNGDDEECAHIAGEGSGDDDSIITPVYKAVSWLRPTPPAPGYNRNKPNVWRNKPCQSDDDDDCVEGSGYEPEPMSNYSNGNYYSTTNRPWTTWTPPTVSPMIRPPVSNGGAGNNFYNTPPPFYTYNGNQYGNEYGNPDHVQPIRPKTTAPSWTKPVYSVSGPTRPIVYNQPIEPQGPPEIYDVPLNIPKVSNETKPLPPPPEVLSKSSNERTVMIISLIAICLIIVVIIAPVVLFFKVRLQSQEAAYKVETFGAHKYGATMPIQGGVYPPFAPVVRATSVSGIGHLGMGPMGMLPPPPPGTMGSMGRSMSRPGTRPGTPTERKKDPHEWYV